MDFSPFRHRFRLGTLGIGAVGGLPLLALLAGPARADATVSASERETARSLMTDGRELRAHNDLRGALTAFKAADALMHVPTTGLEVARTEVALGLLVEARGAIRELFRVPSRADEPRPFAEARAAALALDGELAARIPSLRVVLVNGSRDPRVRIDGVAIPADAAAAAIKVNPGRHVVEAGGVTGAGSARAEVTVAEREDKPVTLTLPAPASEASDPRPPATDAAPPRSQSHTARTIGIVGFGAGGVGLIVGSITGLLSIQKTNALKGGCDGNQCPPTSGGDLDAARSMATVSTLAFVVAGVGVGVGVGALLIGDKSGGDKSGGPDESGKQTARGTSDSLRVTPWIGLGTAGLRGTF
jgi:hypothetical protein